VLYDIGSKLQLGDVVAVALALGALRVPEPNRDTYQHIEHSTLPRAIVLLQCATADHFSH